MEFALFECFLDDVSFRFEAKNEAGLQGLLEAARNVCSLKAFDFAPINQQGIQSLAKEKPKNLNELACALEKIKPLKLKRELEPFVERRELDEVRASKKKGDETDFAFSYYLFLLKQGVFPTRLPSNNAAKQKPFLRLAVNLGGWKAVKKADAASAEKEEVLACMAGIRASATRKLAEMASPGFSAEEALGVKPKKNFSRIPALLREVGNQSEQGFLKEFLAESVFELSGFPCFVSTQQVSECYPWLKIPKPRGRTPRK